MRIGFITAILLCLPTHAFCQPSSSFPGGGAVRVWEKDPFAPSFVQTSDVAGREGASNLSLSTILFSDERSSAVINGKIYRIGDDISGQKIIDIKRTYVILGRGNKTYRLELKK